MFQYEEFSRNKKELIILEELTGLSIYLRIKLFTIGVVAVYIIASLLKKKDISLNLSVRVKKNATNVLHPHFENAA